MIEKLTNGAVSIMDMMGQIGRKTPADYCDLETVDSSTVLVSHKGSLVTLVQVSGIKKLIGAQNYFSQVISSMTTSLSSMFEDKAHAIQVVFEVDHDRTEEQLQNIQRPSEETAKRLGMDLSDLFAARIEVMKEWTAAERCYIALWTNPEALSKLEVKEEKKLAMGKLDGEDFFIRGYKTRWPQWR